MLAAPASDLVHALKYGGWHELAGFMAERMTEAARDILDSVRRESESDSDSIVVTPMPTTHRRERRRGYNQAALLADRVGAGLHLPVRSLLSRPVERRSQIELEPAERRVNVRGVFAPGATAVALQGHAVVLVDDVLTTGATASEAANVLLEQGAGSVHLLTFARALPEAVSGLS